MLSETFDHELRGVPIPGDGVATIRFQENRIFADHAVGTERPLPFTNSVKHVMIVFEVSDRNREGIAAGTAAWIAKVLFLVFLVLFLIGLVGRMRYRPML